MFGGVDDFSHFGGDQAGQEHGFGIEGGEVFACFGGAGLEEEGSSLFGGVDKVGAFAFEVFPGLGKLFIVAGGRFWCWITRCG